MKNVPGDVFCVILASCISYTLNDCHVPQQPAGEQHWNHPQTQANTGSDSIYEFWFSGNSIWICPTNGNTSRILRSFGADVEQLPMFWIVAPLVGMIVQPLIGHYSDNTWNRLGRRKPYFLTGAILSSAALIFLPNAGSLSSIVPALWMGAGMVMIMDASFNVAMEPFRALVADNLPDSQRTSGFAVQTFLIGIGAVVGSELPSFLANHGFSQEAGESGVADNIRYSFTLEPPYLWQLY